MQNDNPITRLLYAILSQKCLKDINWDQVANNPLLNHEITNGHAARMRYSRFKKQMDAASGNVPPATPRKPRKSRVEKTKSPKRERRSGAGGGVKNEYASARGEKGEGEGEEREVKNEYALAPPGPNLNLYANRNLTPTPPRGHHPSLGRSGIAGHHPSLGRSGIAGHHPSLGRSGIAGPLPPRPSEPRGLDQPYHAAIPIPIPIPIPVPIKRERKPSRNTLLHPAGLDFQSHGGSHVASSGGDGSPRMRLEEERDRGPETRRDLGLGRDEREGCRYADEPSPAQAQAHPHAPPHHRGHESSHPHPHPHPHPPFPLHADPDEDMHSLLHGFTVPSSHPVPSRGYSPSPLMPGGSWMDLDLDLGMGMEMGLGGGEDLYGEFWGGEMVSGEGGGERSGMGAGAGAGAPTAGRSAPGAVVKKEERWGEEYRRRL